MFDRRFLFRILPMGHSQLAEFIGARGPNTHVNAACAVDRPGRGPRRGLDPRRTLPAGGSGRGRQPLERQPDGVDRLRLPRHRRGGHRRQGRGRGPALRSPPSRDADGDGRLRHGGGEPGRGGGARACAGSWSFSPARPPTAPSTPPASTWSTSPGWWRASWPPPSAATGVNRMAMAPRDGLHLPRDLHPRAGRQRRRRGHGPAEGLRLRRQPDRRLQHQGLHRPPDGRRRRGRDRREDPRARDRAPGAELQGAGSRAGHAQPVAGRPLSRPVRDPPGRRLRLADRPHSHPADPRRSRSSGRPRRSRPLAGRRERLRPAPRPRSSPGPCASRPPAAPDVPLPRAPGASAWAPSAGRPCRGAGGRVNERRSGRHCCPGATALSHPRLPLLPRQPLAPSVPAPPPPPSPRSPPPRPRPPHPPRPTQSSSAAWPSSPRRPAIPPTCSTSSWISRPTSVSTP